MSPISKRPPKSVFDLLLHHGFEVADYTLYGHNDDHFNYIGYASTHWGKQRDL